MAMSWIAAGVGTFAFLLLMWICYCAIAGVPVRQWFTASDQLRENESVPSASWIVWRLHSHNSIATLFRHTVSRRKVASVCLRSARRV